MSKEGDLKKIELRVSVICCDGCKRKVKKSLQGIEGVLKTEIDPLQPKVTVFGNVDPQILIKRLLKTGKQAELCRVQNTGKENKGDNLAASMKEKDAKKPVNDQVKSSVSFGIATDKNKDAKNYENPGENKAPKNDQKETVSNVNFSNPIPEVVKKEAPIAMESKLYEYKHPAMVQDSNKVCTWNQYCYKVEPYAVAMPYYAVPSFAITPLPPTSYGHVCQEYSCQERPVFQPPFQAPAARVGDYFSDENTMGCHIM